MNLTEMLDLVDYFLVTEANVTHTGEARNFEFLNKHQSELEAISSKVKCIRMDLHQDTEMSYSDSEILHSNEQKIRDGFRKEVPLHPKDIVISCDADEVLFGTRVSSLIRRIQRSSWGKDSYRLRLNQVIFRLNYLWKDCNFQGPVVCRAEHFIKQANPQWRYSGSRTFRKSGTHFSWVMTIEDMVKKIHRYSHRAENEKFASYEILKHAVEEKKYIFEPERKFTIVEIDSYKEKCYPPSLRKYISLFPREVV